jgi:hypothetical protein
MPNHVTTLCSVTGPQEEITRFRAAVIRTPSREDEDILDFDAIVPIPPVLLKTSAGSSADLGIEIMTGKPKPDIFGFPPKSALEHQRFCELGITTIGALRSWAEQNQPDAIEEGEKAIAAYDETGFYDWHDWSVVNWGTKWNIYYFRFDNSTLEDGLLSFRFDTAWSFPSPIFGKLSEMFPGLRFDCTCFDEGWCFAGRGAFNGEPAFEIVEPTDELYEIVYGVKPDVEGCEENAASGHNHSCNAILYEYPGAP